MFGRSLKFGRSGDRTRDLMLSSATLYQLSYAAMFMFDVGQLLVSIIHIRDVIGSCQTAVRVGLGNLRLQSELSLDCSLSRTAVCPPENFTAVWNFQEVQLERKFN